MDLNLLKEDNLFDAALTFFKDTIGLQLETMSRNPINVERELEKDEIRSKKVDKIWNYVDKTYYIGLLDDDNFGKNTSDQEGHDLIEDLKEVDENEDEYPGILIFAVDLNPEFNPTRSNLTEINRTLNRFSQQVPALVLARYEDKVSLMLADRVAYKQEWRKGEKVRKVSLLRDIDLSVPHAGHMRILNDLIVPTSGTKKVQSFDELYEYWKAVLDTSELNKKFYQDLSHWYFWAIKHVRFPNEPTLEDAHEQDKELEDMLQEHRATNVIRLLTRLLFVWFVKEKGLISEELFDLKTLQKDILKKITPHHEVGMFSEANKESIYYKAILQNLFFATLNCPIEASDTDDRERGFRNPKNRNHFGVMFLMRYEQYFKDQEAFLELVNSKVPFLNGGLFECLDIRGEKEDKEDRVYVDGFSDNLPKEHKLIVPDFLFFGVEEHVDLSEEYGLKRKKYKEAAVKGLLNIFNSYKFTITENTPIEEDVALDPELLGKVFENLLASYNPETKTTARKQTGSFYTPREIVNYMVDESLIAYLKNAIEDWDSSDEELDEKLHQLTSYEDTVPFEENEGLHRKIITALSDCTILDPACGSGAFPMGILQKMVHILQKLDPENAVWKEVQKQKASREADRAISEIADKEERGQRLKEINEAFDEGINAPDYARKLFLIENCIYGVDIQPVAAQISKLRFFISLVVEQKVGDNQSNNFGIRPLPNLETKFVTANTLIDIKDNSNQMSLYETETIKKLEAELKQVRSKLFSARTTQTKYKHRQEDERLRNEIAAELKQTGWPNEAADKLASWDPYDQNASSPFFNPEWMFDISDGFDILIGNPPWGADLTKEEKNLLKQRYQEIDSSTPNSFAYFLGEAVKDAKGVISYVLPDSILIKDFSKTRKLIKDMLYEIYWYLNTGIPEESKPFVYVEHDVCVLLCNKQKLVDSCSIKKLDYNFDEKESELENYFLSKDKFIREEHEYSFNLKITECEIQIYEMIKHQDKLSSILQCHEGIHTGNSRDLLFFPEKKGESFKKLFHGSRAGDQIQNYKSSTSGWYVDYRKEIIKNKKGKYASLRDERLFKCPKIYITRTGNPITAFFDKDTYASNNFFSLQFKDYKKNNEEKLKTILPLILSKFANYYIRTFAAPRLGDTYIETKIFHILKIPYIESIIDNRSVKQLTDIIIYQISRKSDYSVFQTVVDSLILEFYFFTEMSDLNIDVSKYIKEDLNNNPSISEFEELTNSEKEEVIKQLHEQWTDPENEVRKRINSFPVKSPDILKPILEG